MLPLRADATTGRIPIVTLVVIALSILVFVVFQPRGELNREQYFLEKATIPCELDQGSPLTQAELETRVCGPHPDAGRAGRTELYPDKNIWAGLGWTMFLHVDVWHLLANMWFLWIFGRSLEGHLGPLWFLVAYAFFGTVSSAAFVALNPDVVATLVGASGAVAGVLGAYFVLWPRARVVSLLGWIVVPVPAVFWLAAWAALQFTPLFDDAAWEAHLGGLAAGVVVAIVLRVVLGPPRDPVHEAFMAGRV
jgi:membrane associated rhomboid family serine protease